MPISDKPLPELTPAEAAAVRKVAKAVHESPLGDLDALPPVGAELRDLARRIDGMHDDEGPADG
ncbi:hypothetical protein [Methylobacterium sp. SD21]|uniref:hypothetical protein n=1 Tax=Methylobacterium litchii TaxID=3138810 RepID=UPI00313BC477